MKTNKRLICSVLALAVATSFTACAPKTNNSTASTTDSKTEPKVESKMPDSKPAPIKWLTTGDSGAKPLVPNDRVIQTMNEKLGIVLSLDIVPDGSTEKVNVAMASGDLPDVVTGAYGTSATQQWIDDGMLVAMNDYLGDNPDLKALLENDYPWTAIDGKYYGAPFITQYKTANSLVIMRQDWLTKLNLKYPETLTDMKEVLKAFVENDPDGNGKKDTYGLTGTKTTYFDWVFFANGLKNGDYALDASGTVIPWFEDASFVPSMTYIKELWDNGYIDSELMLNDNTKAEEKFYQGRVGAVQVPLFRHVTRHEGNLQKVFPDASIVYNLPPKGETGTFGLNKQGKAGFYTAVTVKSKAPEKAMKFVDFMLSKEGTDLLRLGVDGVHYTKDGDKITFNEEERAKDAFADNGWAHPIAWGSLFWPLESGYIPQSDPALDRALETTKLASQAQVQNLIKQKFPAEIKSGSALDSILAQEYSNMLQGKVTIAEGVAKLSKSWRSQGGEEVLKEANEVYKNQKS